MKNDTQRLARIDARIQEIMEEWGLTVVPTDFEIIPAQRMFEIMAYGLPVNFRHWSRGRDYERVRTIYEHSGLGLPYETVLNTSPPKAFLMETNPFAIQVMVIAHVYAHVDFFRENLQFKEAPEDILPKAYEMAKRFDYYEHHYGISRTEPLIDAGLALQFNIDPDIHKSLENRDEQFERLYGETDDGGKPVDAFYKLFPRQKKKRPDFWELAHKTPLEPERDLLGYLIDHSPKPLDRWEQDVLSSIRTQGMYFYPQLRTKIMNEGWASYWHEQAMRKLFEEGLLNTEEHGYYAQYHAAVLAPNRFQLNPYRVGRKMFEDIRKRWDCGRFGRQWRECEDDRERECWDKGLGEGLEKMFSVRRIYSDRMFIEHFLTDDLIHDMNLYIYEERKTMDGGSEIVIAEHRPEIIRQQLKEVHADGGQPRIVVEDGNYRGRHELYLRHIFEGAPLDYEYLQKTVEHIYHLWGRNVHLETVDVLKNDRGELSRRNVVYQYDGIGHSKKG